MTPTTPWAKPLPAPCVLQDTSVRAGPACWPVVLDTTLSGGMTHVQHVRQDMHVPPLKIQTGVIFVPQVPVLTIFI